jgi:hypothetical protein
LPCATSKCISLAPSNSRFEALKFERRYCAGLFVLSMVNYWCASIHNSPYTLCIKLQLIINQAPSFSCRAWKYEQYLPSVRLFNANFVKATH